MVESKDIEAMVNQMGIQAATVVAMTLREAETGPGIGASTAGSREVHRQRHCKKVPEQPSFNLNVTDN